MSSDPVKRSSESTPKSPPQSQTGPFTQAQSKPEADQKHAGASSSKLTEQLASDNFSISEAVGGWQGIAEAVAPTLVLIIAYVATQKLFWPVILALVITVIFAVARLVAKQSLKQVLAGLVVTVISVVWAWKTGRVENFFAFGFWINGVYAAVILVTILLKRPLIGWLVAAFTGQLETWRTPSERHFYRRSYWATWAWILLLLFRLLVELPLYYLELTTALGITRIVLGVPAFAVIIYLTWALMREPVQRALAGQKGNA